MVAADAATVSTPSRRRWVSWAGWLLLIAVAMAFRYESIEWRAADGSLLGWKWGFTFSRWTEPAADAFGQKTASVEVKRHALLGLYRSYRSHEIGPSKEPPK